MVGDTVEFVNCSGLFQEGLVIEESDNKIVIEDKQGRLWEGQPSQVIFPNVQQSEVIPLDELDSTIGKPHGTDG